MKVKFIDSESNVSIRHFTINKIYTVYEMSINKETGKLNFRLQCDDGTPIISEANGFEIIDNSIPSSWIMKKWSDTYFLFSPSSWQTIKNQRSFWEDFFDGEPWALELYQKELDETFSD